MKHYVELDYLLEDDNSTDTGGISHTNYTLEEFLLETDTMDEKDELLSDINLTKLNQYLKDAGIKQIFVGEYIKEKELPFIVSNKLLETKFTKDEIEQIKNYYNNFQQAILYMEDTTERTVDNVELAELLDTVFEQVIHSFMYDISEFHTENEGYSRTDFLEHVKNIQTPEMIYKKIMHHLVNCTVKDLSTYLEEIENLRDNLVMILDTKISADELEIEHFHQFLKESPEFWTNHEGEICFDEYVDYRDQLSMDTIRECINEAIRYEWSLESTIYEHLDMYNELAFPDKVWEVSNNYIDKFYNELDFKEQEKLREELESYIYNTVKYDNGISTLLSNSAPHEVVVYFGNNWDDDNGSLSCWVDAFTIVNNNEDLSDELIDDLKNTTLGWLLEKQGYCVIDVFRDVKDKFIKDVSFEILEDSYDIHNYQLIATPNVTDWDAIMNLYNGKDVILKAGTTFGLFNRIHGSGSLLGITTVKDIVINKDNIYELVFDAKSNNNDYLPSDVYGYTASSDKKQLVQVD